MQREKRHGESKEADSPELEIIPPWGPSPWILLDVRYQSHCPVCGQVYNSSVETFNGTSLPTPCRTPTHGYTKGLPGCRGIVPASAL
jgi:hypothetical protein